MDWIGLDTRKLVLTEDSSGANKYYIMIKMSFSNNNAVV